VSPSPISTPFADKMGLSPQDLKAMAETVEAQVPLQRFGEAERSPAPRCSWRVPTVPSSPAQNSSSTVACHSSGQFRENSKKRPGPHLGFPGNVRGTF